MADQCLLVFSSAAVPDRVYKCIVRVCQGLSLINLLFNLRRNENYGIIFASALVNAKMSADSSNLRFFVRDFVNKPVQTLHSRAVSGSPQVLSLSYYPAFSVDHTLFHAMNPVITTWLLKRWCLYEKRILDIKLADV